MSKVDIAENSYLTFARQVLVQLRQWAKSSPVPEYHDVKTIFEQGGAREAVSVRPNYWSLLKQHDIDLMWIASVAAPCIKVHLEQGILKTPSITDPEGKPILEPTLEQVCSQFTMALFSVVLDAVESKDSLRIDASVLRTFYRYHRSMWSSSTSKQLVRIPLFNCTTETDFRVGDVFELCAFTNEEKTEYFNRFGGLHQTNFSLWDFSTSQCKLSGYFFHDSAEGPHFGIMFFEARSVVTAMRLMKKGMVGASSVHYHADCPPLRTPSGGTVLSDFRLPRFVQDPYLITKEDVIPLISLVSILRGNLLSKLAKLNVALNRFNMSYSRDNANDKLLDLTIALESCLLAGIGSSEEITYKFSLRGSTILSRLKDPVDAYAFLRYIYRLRSAIVHEGKSLFDEDKRLAPPKINGSSLERGKIIELCEDYTRLIVKEYIAKLMTGVPIEKVNADLDNAVVSALRFVSSSSDTSA